MDVISFFVFLIEKYECTSIQFPFGANSLIKEKFNNYNRRDNRIPHVYRQAPRRSA